MLDPSGMYPDGFHPIQINRHRDLRGRAQRFTRTDRPTRYYLIDFGLSQRYSSRDALDVPLRGGDKTAPEHQLGRRCNPFHTDIYYLGNLIRERFLNVICIKIGWFVAHLAFQVYTGFAFMEGLVDAMTNVDPGKRPMIEEVILRFSRIRDSLSRFKLRSLMITKKDPSLITAFRYARQVVRTAKYLLTQKASVPLV
jgi:hypothetical protein